MQAHLELWQARDSTHEVLCVALQQFIMVQYDPVCISTITSCLTIDLIYCCFVLLELALNLFSNLQDSSNKAMDKVSPSHLPTNTCLQEGC